MNDATLDTFTVEGSTQSKSSRAKSAVGRTDEAAGPARPATSGPTAKERWLEIATELESAATTDAPSSEPSGSDSPAGDEKVTSYSGSLSTSLGVRSGAWKTPRSIMELAAQANVVATQLLNDVMPVPKARAYGSIARAVSGLLRAELEHQRWVGGDLFIPNDDVYEE